MANNTAKRITEELLSGADVQINGGRPWDIKVHDERLYQRVLSSGSLGLGESYMDGWWDCEQIDEFIARILRANLNKAIVKNWAALWLVAKGALSNLQRKTKAFEVGERHYDIGNDLYNAMLDKRLVYTCAYWRSSQTLDEAQEAKLDLTCRKLGIKPGMTILDVGCGWGSFAKFAAEKYGARVTGITVSKEQVELGNKMCAGLPVEILLQDYRDVKGTYDRIVSLGMFEHVGYKNYRTYMDVVNRSLKPDGLFLLQTIAGNKSTTTGDAWLDKYIFPNGMLPSVKQVGASIEGLFTMEDWHNFGPDYEKTLLAWHHNFVQAWPTLRSRYDNRFYRMWRYYLLSCAGAFRARRIQLWQIVLSKQPQQPYCSIR